MDKFEPHRHIVHREIHIELYYVVAYVSMSLCGSRNYVLTTYMPLKERNNSQPSLFENSAINRVIESAEYRTEGDVVDLKFGFVIKHRPSLKGEG